MRKLVVVVSLLCAACRAQPPASSAGADQVLPPATPAPASAPIAARFECDDITVDVVFDGAQATLTMPNRTVTLPQAVSASGARYTDGKTIFWNKGNEATFELDGRTRECRVRRDPWQEAQARGIDFRALGQEPGWYLEIDRDRSMRLVYDYAEREATTSYAAPRVEREKTTYHAVTEAHDLTVVVEARVCHDGMSGEAFTATVNVTIDGRALQGCGRALGEAAAGAGAWTVSALQVGPVRIGMTVAEAQAALGGPFEPLTEAGECTYRRSAVAPAGVLFMQVDDRIVRADIREAGVPTDAGVEVGASELRVREAYGGRVVASPHKYTDGRYLTITPSSESRMVFETDGKVVTRYRVGRIPEVEWVEGCA